MKNDFCSSCGTRFESHEWPRVCTACHMEHFLNPTPVVVILQPVEVEEENGSISKGIIIGKRAIEPAKGEWSLISGYMDIGETAEDAARREFREETGLEVESDPQYAYSSYNKNNVLILFFYIGKSMSIEKFRTHKCCPENEKLEVLWESGFPNLAFPLQSIFTERYFAGEFRS